MKLFVLDKFIVCSLEDKNGAFLSETAGCFKDFYRHNLKLCNDDFYSELDCLTQVIFAAERHGIEIAEEVREAYRSMSERKSAIEKGLEEQRRIEAETKQREERWERLQKQGCKGCTNCYPTGFDDDWKCSATGGRLEVKNSPGLIGSTYALFNYKPFPTDNCPYKI